MPCEKKETSLCSRMSYDEEDLARISSFEKGASLSLLPKSGTGLKSMEIPRKGSLFMDSYCYPTALVWLWLLIWSTTISSVAPVSYASFGSIHPSDTAESEAGDLDINRQLWMDIYYRYAYYDPEVKFTESLFRKSGDEDETQSLSPSPSKDSSIRYGKSRKKDTGKGETSSSSYDDEAVESVSPAPTAVDEGKDRCKTSSKSSSSMRRLKGGKRSSKGKQAMTHSSWSRFSKKSKESKALSKDAVCKEETKAPSSSPRPTMPPLTAAPIPVLTDPPTPVPEDTTNPTFSLQPSR